MPEKTKIKEFNSLLAEARAQLENGAVLQAMNLFYSLHELDPDSAVVLEQLVAINLQLQRQDHAMVCLNKLIILEPQKTDHYDQAALLHLQAGEPQKAYQIYQRLVVKCPELPEAHYNLAFYLSKSGNFNDAVESYQKALALNVDQPEEVYLNLAVIYADHYRQEAQAENFLEQALKLNPHYLPALYNLANIHENRGDKVKSRDCFHRILAQQPQNARVLSRIIPIEDSDKASPHIQQLQKIVDEPELDYSDKIDALYALGNAFDDLSDYDQAYTYFEQANAINKLEMRPYDKQESEAYFNQIRQVYSAEWIANHRSTNTESPIFICGMFRSGSTLVEQILASHPAITAGGERDFILRKLSDLGIASPQDALKLDAEQLQIMADKYTENTQRLFTNANQVTDKRPDNVLHLGLIKSMFPNAKIICTRRNLLDNCLSVHFVRLAKAMNYAVNLDHIAHYYSLQESLVEYWRSLFGSDLLIVDYDEIVTSPKSAISNLLTFLGLDWNDQCLNFHQLNNTVKTASVWQVRKPLFTKSSGRWKNYEHHLVPAIDQYQK